MPNVSANSISLSEILISL